MIDKLEDRLLLNIKYQIEQEVLKTKIEPVIVGSGITPYSSIDTSTYDLEPSPSKKKA